MADSTTYHLEHIYFGQFVRDNKPDGDPRVLAYSPGIKQEAAEQIVQEVSLSPLDTIPEGAWAIVRGESVPFLMVQSQYGAAGQLMMHYTVLPSEVLRALGGNVDTLRAFVEPQMESYARLGDRLKPLRVEHAMPPSKDVQIDAILELMTYAKNRTGMIESLLAAVVQGVQVVVTNGPDSLDPRVDFIKGLLSLLPPPARFGVTFSTHSLPQSDLDAQIRFVQEGGLPGEALIFDWAAAQTSGKTVNDDYSHFIISQLRLDTELVFQETQALTAVAAWRIKRGDSLADALGYASNRMALDRALRNNQPVEIDDVAEVLANDRTLSDEMRRIYARHVLSLALAMGETEYADPVAMMLRRDEELERLTLDMLQEALRDGQAALVFYTLARWLNNPMGPHSDRWVELAHRSMQQHMDTMGNQGNVEGINDFLRSIEELGPGMELQQAMPNLIELALPLSLKHPPLAETLFILAVSFLNNDMLFQQLRAPRYLDLLPNPLSLVVAALEKRQPTSRLGANLLAEAASAFGPEWEPLVLLRLTDLAMDQGRVSLLNVDILGRLAEISQTRWGHIYNDRIKQIALYFSEDSRLARLPEPGPLYLWQIFLLQKDYNVLVEQLLHHARVLYPGDKQGQYITMLQRLFADTGLAAPAAFEALRYLKRGSIKGVPYLMAQIGVLDRHEGQPGVDRLAQDILKELSADQGLTRAMPPRAMRDLLTYFLKREDMSNAVRVGSLYPDVACYHGVDGIGMMISMYRTLYQDNKEMQVAALELLRRYIRQSDTNSARRALVQFGRELGLNVRDALEATYAVKRLMGGVSILDYAEFLHRTVELIEGTALAYAERNQLPTLGGLVNSVQSLAGGLMEDESRAIATSIMGMAESMMGLYEHYRQYAPRNADRHIESLIKGEIAPRSGLDVLWIFGGYFANGKRYRMRFTPVQHPFGELSAPALRTESEISHQLLRGLLQAFPGDKEMNITVEAVQGEIESIWGVIPEIRQKSIVRDLAIDFQRLAQLLIFIGENGDLRALQDSGLGRRIDGGKHQPKNTIEFYRYVYSYFKIS